MVQGSMKYFSSWSIRTVHYIFYLEIFQKYWYVFFFWKCSICCIFLLIIKMFYFFAVEIDLSMLNFSLSIVDSLFLIFKSSDFLCSIMLLQELAVYWSIHTIKCIYFFYSFNCWVVHLIHLILVCLFCFYLHFWIYISKHKFGYEISYMIETYSSY